jgi:hypothetical protein
VGNDTPAGAEFASVAEAWNGKSWRLLPTPQPAGAGAWLLDGVSCRSATSCTAVGYQQTTPSAAERPLVETWNGTTWSVGTMPDVATAISCTSAVACTAVAGADIEAWNGTAWRVQPTPARPGAALSGVSCIAGGACTVVGTWTPSKNASTTLAEHRA